MHVIRLIFLNVKQVGGTTQQDFENFLSSIYVV